jgi:hypothetical protein
MEILASSPDQFAAFQAREQARWFKVIEDNDIRSDSSSRPSACRLCHSGHTFWWTRPASVVF